MSHGSGKVSIAREGSQNVNTIVVAGYIWIILLLAGGVIGGSVPAFGEIALLKLTGC